MKIILSLMVIYSISLGGRCYTASAGFRAVGDVSEKLSSRTSSSTNKISKLGDIAKERQSRLEQIRKLQMQIKEIQGLNYIKSQNILHNLKTKNTLLDIKGSMLKNIYFSQ